MLVVGVWTLIFPLPPSEVGAVANNITLECGYHRTLNVTEAMELDQAAIVAGIQNELGSGSQSSRTVATCFAAVSWIAPLPPLCPHVGLE